MRTVFFTCRRLRTASAALATAAPAHILPCTSREARGNEAALPVHKEWARRRFGALNNGASRSRARRALTNLARLVARANTRRARGHRRFKHVLGHVGWGRALTLQHIPSHIRLRRARRHRRLQHVFAPVDCGTAFTVIITSAATRLPVTSVTRVLGNVHEKFHISSKVVS